MGIKALKELYERDLKRLKQEIELYRDDTTLWKIENSIKNSGGNLCLHLIGNLKTYIGNGLAQIGYIRQRDLEFSDQNVDRCKLYDLINLIYEYTSSRNDYQHGNKLLFPVHF